MQEHKVSMFEPLPLALGATIMVIGIGGNIGYEGGFSGADRRVWLVLLDSGPVAG